MPFGNIPPFVTPENTIQLKMKGIVRYLCCSATSCVHMIPVEKYTFKDIFDSDESKGSF